MEKSHVSTLLRRNSALLRHNIGTQKGNLLPLFLAAVFLTLLLVGSTGSAEILRSFQSPVSPVIGPPEPATGPAAPTVPPLVAFAPVLWIVIGLVVVVAFVVGLVFFQKQHE